MKLFYVLVLPDHPDRQINVYAARAFCDFLLRITCPIENALKMLEQAGAELCQAQYSLF